MVIDVVLTLVAMMISLPSSALSSVGAGQVAHLPIPDLSLAGAVPYYAEINYGLPLDTFLQVFGLLLGVWGVVFLWRLAATLYSMIPIVGGHVG